MEKSINVVSFSEYPGPRYVIQGDYSGEDFYNKVLNPAFAEVIQVGGRFVVNLDQTAGYASSFLDEAFGELTYDFTEEKVRKHLTIISNDEPYWIDLIFNKTIPQWEKRRVDNNPRKTTNAPIEIFAIIDGILQKITK